MTRLIDADALKQNAYTSYECASQPCKVVDVSDIDDAPTVDAEPVRHGEWIKIRGMMPPEYMGLKACSVCGWHIHPLGRTAFDLKESEFRYCPRCGARLDRERKDDGND